MRNYTVQTFRFSVTDRLGRTEILCGGYNWRPYTCGFWHGFRGVQWVPTVSQLAPQFRTRALDQYLTVRPAIKPAELPVGSLTKSTAPELEPAAYLSDSQDLEEFGPDVTAALVILGDGEYLQVWTYEGSQPYSVDAIFTRVQ